jgi:hypothetical protein
MQRLTLNTVNTPTTAGCPKQEGSEFALATAAARTGGETPKFETTEDT